MRFDKDIFLAGMNAGNQKVKAVTDMASDEKRLRLAAQLRDQALTQEQKLYQLYQQDPEGFGQYMKQKDPFKMDEMGIKRDELELRRQKLKYLMNQPYPGMQPTTRMREYQYLINLGLPQEKALQYLYRPDLITTILQGMGQNQNNNLPRTGPNIGE